MKIAVLGTGCTKCNKLFALTEQALSEAGVTAELEKIESIDQIVSYGVLMTPALVIDGEVKCAGKLPSATRIAEWLRAASQ
ncbi:MAG: thioredoxin family protein [Deltaproteobacteria bacterium]|nr:MAG: thioredoxin family protein [Deltaproteobacteria bacterium]